MKSHDHPLAADRPSQIRPDWTLAWAGLEPHTFCWWYMCVERSIKQVGWTEVRNGQHTSKLLPLLAETKLIFCPVRGSLSFFGHLTCTCIYVLMFALMLSSIFYTLWYDTEICAFPWTNWMGHQNEVNWFQGAFHSFRVMVFYTVSSVFTLYALCILQYYKILSFAQQRLAEVSQQSINVNSFDLKHLHFWLAAVAVLKTM